MWSFPTMLVSLLEQQLGLPQPGSSARKLNTERVPTSCVSLHILSLSISKNGQKAASPRVVVFLLGLTPLLCFLADMANLSLHDHDGSSGASDQDTLAPLPHPGAAPWPMAFPYQYPPPHPYNPHPGFPDPGYSYGGGSAGSQHSEGE